MGSRVRLRSLNKFINEWVQTKRYCSSQSSGLSYYHNPGSEPLQYLTFGQLTRRAAERWPDTDVFVSVQQKTALTFSQLEEQTDKLAAGLLDLGLEPGDRVGICSPNSEQWFLTTVATAKAGLILVTMNPAYKKTELEYCLKKVGVKALVTDESSRTQQYYRMISEIVPHLSRLPPDSKFACNNLPNLAYVIVNSEKVLPGTFRFQDVLESTDNFERLHRVQRILTPEYIGNIQFTSGTTGNPKAVPLSQFHLINNAYFVGKRLGLKKKHSKILAQSPFFHALGYIGAVMVSLNFGSSVILPSPTFNVIASCEAIKTEKCTMLLGTPTMYVDLCSHVMSLPPDEQLLYQSPEIAVSGGALCLPGLFRTMKNTFSCDRLVSFYGMTEATAIAFQSEAQDSEYLMTSTVGRVGEHFEVKVVDSEGVTAPLGTAGELWMRSYCTMAGYWEDHQSTAKIIDQDRWLKTGDKVVLLEGGYGQVVGRIKDMIIRGGENISPKEIEEFLLLHPDIIDSQVYAVTSERLGEEVACSLRVKPGTKITVEQVKDFCKDKISNYKIPKYMEFVDDFPKTESGKIQKFKLRQAMEEKLGINKKS